MLEKNTFTFNRRFRSFFLPPWNKHFGSRPSLRYRTDLKLNKILPFVSEEELQPRTLPGSKWRCFFEKQNRWKEFIRRCISLIVSLKCIYSDWKKINNCSPVATLVFFSSACSLLFFKSLFSFLHSSTHFFWFDHSFAPNDCSWTYCWDKWFKGCQSWKCRLFLYKNPCWVLSGGSSCCTKKQSGKEIKTKVSLLFPLTSPSVQIF